MKNKTVRQTHDKFFKAAMADLRVAKGFLQTHLPLAVCEALDFDSLILQPASYVDQSLKTLCSDVLYQARLKAGETAYVYLLCEHQSTTDPLMAFRIWQYVINIWADHLKQAKGKTKLLPLICPLVFYTGANTYCGSNDIRDLIHAPAALIEQTLFKQTFQLIDVNQLNEDELQRQQWAGMMALIMKHIHDRDIVLFLKQIVSSLQHLEQVGGTDYVLLLLNYCLTSGETLDIEQFVATVQQGLSSPTGEKIMTIAEQLIKKGKAEGKAEGRAETLKAIAKKGIEQGLPFSAIQQLTGLSKKELEEIQKTVIH